MNHARSTRMQRRIRLWWRRPAGGKAVWTIALPLLVSTGSWTIMNFMDRMFLSWYSQPAFAAVMPAGMLLWVLFVFPMGIAGYVSTFVAQYHGAGRPERIGAAMGQAIRFALIVAPCLLLSIPFAEHVFLYLAKHDPTIARQEVLYFQTLAWGAGGAVLSAALSGFFTGLGRTRVIMGVMLTTTTINLILDWLLIFGWGPFPQLGIVGAGLATVIAQWTRVVLYSWLVFRPKEREKYRLHEAVRYNPELMRRLLKYGMPNGLQLLVEHSAFAIFLLLLGKLGQHALAATTLAFNINSVAFVPLIGLGIAVSTLVGQELGANRPQRAARATWTALQMALLYSGFFGVMYIAIPDVFMVGHAGGISAEEFARLRETTIVLLRFVAAYCLFDSVNIIFASALKGAGDTRFVLWAEIIISPLPVVATFVGVTMFGQGVYFCWAVITAWITLFSLIFAARFLQGAWKSMRVIEEEAVLEVEAAGADVASILGGPEPVLAVPVQD